MAPPQYDCGSGRCDSIDREVSAVTIARLTRVFASSALDHTDKRILIRGWVFRLRSLASTTFIVLRDCSGEIQCVMATEAFKELQLKLDDAVEITGRIRLESRAKS